MEYDDINPSKVTAQREEDFDGGTVAVKKEGKWGFINKNGDLIVPFEYDSCLNYFNKNIVAVEKDNKWGFVDKSGNVVIPFEYDVVQYIKEGFYVVGYSVENSADQKVGIIDNNGNTIVPLIYDRILFWEDEYVCVQNLNTDHKTFKSGLYIVD